MNAFFASKFRSSALLAAGFMALGAFSLNASTGNELLMGSLKPTDMNKGVIECGALTEAVSLAVASDPSKAPEIVGAAIPKTRSMDCQKAIITAAIKALGDYTKLDEKIIPVMVATAIRSAPNCGSGGKDVLDGKSKDGAGGCECARQFTDAAIRALGENPPQYLVENIVISAVQAAGGQCASQIGQAATDAAPQYADTIADIAARAAEGDFQYANGSPIYVTETQRPIPLPFIFPPSLSGTIAPGEVTPVN